MAINELDKTAETIQKLLEALKKDRKIKAIIPPARFAGWVKLAFGGSTVTKAFEAKGIKLNLPQPTGIYPEISKSGLITVASHQVKNAPALLVTASGMGG